jgi:hypothetical protein
VSEDVRAYGWENILGAVIADLRYGLRRLRATPGFTAITILTLAIGIGWTTAIFGAVNPILFEPLPYPQAGRIMSVLELHAESVGSAIDGTFAMYRRFAERSRTLESIAVFKPWQPTVTGVDQPERLTGQRVSAAYFHVLGVAPIVGRDFDPPTTGCAGRTSRFSATRPGGGTSPEILRSSAVRSCSTKTSTRLST